MADLSLLNLLCNWIPKVLIVFKPGARWPVARRTPGFLKLSLCRLSVCVCVCVPAPEAINN